MTSRFRQKEAAKKHVPYEYFAEVIKQQFGISEWFYTLSSGLYHPKRGLNIFLVILSFFRPFRYGKNDLSRSRGILSPGAPIVSMVAYVVVKIRSQIDGFGLMGADDFLLRSVVNLCGRSRSFSPSGSSYFNSSSAICQEIQQLKFAPQ